MYQHHQNMEEKDYFYSSLDKDKTQCKSKVITTMADLNAKVGNEWEGKIVGKFRLGTWNECNKRWAQCCITNYRIITWTWRNPEEPDWLLIIQKCRFMLKNISKCQKNISLLNYASTKSQNNLFFDFYWTIFGKVQDEFALCSQLILHNHFYWNNIFMGFSLYHNLFTNTP